MFNRCRHKCDTINITGVKEDQFYLLWRMRTDVCLEVWRYNKEIESFVYALILYAFNQRTIFQIT